MWLGIGYTIPHQGDRNVNRVTPTEEYYLLHEDGRILDIAYPYDGSLERAEAPNPV